MLAQRNGVRRAATRAEHDVVKGGGDNPHVSLLATRLPIWCLIMTLLLRKAGSRLVQTSASYIMYFIIGLSSLLSSACPQRQTSLHPFKVSPALSDIHQHKDVQRQMP